MRILLVVGTRPNVMKCAAVASAFDAADIEYDILHTGQHYDRNMSGTMFTDLGLREPFINLGAGGMDDNEQFVKVISGVDNVLKNSVYDWVMVFGDVNSTAAAALAARKRGVRVAHVEAGLRCGDRSMPEETNRIIADAVSDILFYTDGIAAENLRREGRQVKEIRWAGDTMVDSVIELMRRLSRVEVPYDVNRALSGHGITRECTGYAMATLHRQGNVDVEARLRRMVDIINSVAKVMKVVFPVHPRTFKRMNEQGLKVNCCMAEPMGYADFTVLLSNAAMAITDSGGVQVEAAYHGVPCVVLRSNTERPMTVRIGATRLVDDSMEKVMQAYEDVKSGAWGTWTVPNGWDGKAGARIADAMKELR